MQRSIRRQNIFTKIDNHLKSLVWHYEMRSRIVKDLIKVQRRKIQDNIDMKFFSEISQLLFLNAIFFFLHMRNTNVSTNLKVIYVGFVATSFYFSMKMIGQKASFDHNLIRRSCFGQWLRVKVDKEGYGLTLEQQNLYQHYKRVFIDPCIHVDKATMDHLQVLKQQKIEDQARRNEQIIKL